jgi:hypothetical protein
MMKFLFFVLCAFVFCSCDSLERSAYLEACDNVISDQDFVVGIKRTQLPKIEVLPKYFKRRGSYSVLEKDNNWYVCETSIESEFFTIYDVKNGIVLQHNSLNIPKVNIGVSTFKNFDSIYFQLPVKSEIVRFDSSGQINEHLDMSVFRLDWMIADAPFGLHNDIEQGKILFRENGNRLIFPVDAFDFWFYKDKKAIKTVVEYDRASAQLISNFAERDNYLTNGNFSLHRKYTYPFSALGGQYLYLSYPFDHQVYKYDLTSMDLTLSACVSSANIIRLPDPLRKASSTQESINFQLSSPHYGQINFHKELNLFSRLVFVESELYDSEGNINLSTCERKYSLLIFDADLNLINEIDLGNQDLWDKALPVSSGYLLTGKCDTNVGDDYFKYNYYYELVKK